MEARTLPPYEVTGSGPPLLVLSPYAVPAASLTPLRRRLADRFTVIGFDYPGSGSARAALLPLTIPRLAVVAVRLLDHLGYEAADVLGISMGGLVAQELAIDYPERVRGLVLAATTPGGPQAPRGRPRTQAAAWTVLGPPLPGRGVRATGLVSQALAASLHDTSRRLRRIQSYTLVLHGRRDGLVPIANARLLHQGIRSSTLRVLPEADHFFAFREPWVTAEVVIDWWEHASLEPGRASAALRLLRPVAPLAPLVRDVPRVTLANARTVTTCHLRLASRLLGARRI